MKQKNAKLAELKSKRSKKWAYIALGIFPIALATILVEDHLSHAQACADKGIKVLLFGDYHWNKLTRKHNNVELVKNWEEVIKRLLA